MSERHARADASGARARSVLAGVAATGITVGLAELFTGVAAGVSPIAQIAERVIVLAPGGLATAAIDTLGKLGRPAAVLGVVVGVLALGGVLGRLAARWRAAGVLGVLAVAVVGAWAVAARPAASQLDWPSAAAVLAAAVIGAVMLMALLAWLLAEARTPKREPPATAHGLHDAPRMSRRRLLAALSAAVVVGVAGSYVGGVARQRRAVQAGREELVLPEPQRALAPAPGGLDVEGLSALLTPNGDFYRIDTAVSVPMVDHTDWALRVHGMVERPLELTYDQLLERELVEADVTLACVSNEVGGDLVGTARWLGVPLAALLREAGVASDAEQVVGRSVDGWTGGFPLEVALDGRDALVAVGMNGQPLPASHGFPARLVVPGLYGYVSATKWLSDIELATWDFDAYWIPRGWAKEAPIKRQSRIDRPSSGAIVAGPEVVVAGVAWAPLVGVESVELQVDEGSWQAAELGPGLSDATWRQWVWRGELAPGDHRLRVRCVGGDGRRQTGQDSPPRPDGATGWHTVDVTVG